MWAITRRRLSCSAVLKEARGKISPRTIPFFVDRWVVDLLRDFHAAIRDGREQYYLGVIALEKRPKGTLILVDGRKRLTVIETLLDCIRHRLSGSKLERVEEYSREVAQCVDEFLDAILKPMRKVARVKALHRWLEFIERRIFIARVTAPSRTYMKVTRQLNATSRKPIRDGGKGICQ